MWWTVTLSVLVVGVLDAPARPLELAVDGRAGALIVVDDNAVDVDLAAASDLQAIVRDLAGARLVVVPAAAEAAQPQRLVRVFVGELARRDLGDEVEAPGMDGTVLWSRGSALFVFGEGRRGTLYAVTALAERLGVQFLAPDETVVRRRRRLIVPPLRERHTPTFSYREILSRDVIAPHSPFALRRRLNGHHQGIPDAQGGVEAILGYTHTFDKLLPSSRYFAEHPAWYAEIAGRRTPGQLCLQDEGARSALIAEATRWLRDHPDARVISISQNDGHPPCACARCTARVSALGSSTDHLLAFVNDVAAALAAVRPGIVVETLAYRHTTSPPTTVRPADNVLVRLSTIDVDFGRPLVGPGNTDFTTQLAGWRAVAPRLHVWHYVVNFGDFLAPWGNLHRIAPDLRALADAGVTGVLAQGDIWNEAHSFQALRTWLTSAALWDPTRDVEADVDTFLAGYYGPAAAPIRRLLRALQPEGGVELRFGRGAATSTPAFFQAAWPALAEARRRTRSRSGEAPSRFARRVEVEALAVEMAWLRAPLRVRRAVRASLPARLVLESDEVLIERAVAAGGLTDPAAPGFGANRFVREGDPLTRDALRSATLPAAPTTIAWPDDDVVGPRVDLSVERAVIGAGAQIVKDPESPAGRSACIEGDTTSWALQFHPEPGELDGFEEAGVVARLRCLGCEPGASFQWGTWAPTGARRLERQFERVELAVEPTDSEGGEAAIDAGVVADVVPLPSSAWRTYRLPSRQLVSGSYIFVVPGLAVGQLCVDRISLVVVVQP